MKKQIIAFAVLLTIISCNGPKSGPLQKDDFDRTDLSQNMKDQNYKARVSTEKINVSIEPCADCITIANLIENKKTWSDKVIKIRGKVTKYNPSIMGKNWVHIQDGTEYGKEFDLTITTDIAVEVGDTVTFEGTIVLDKDFGYGYKYNVLMEDGKPAL